MRWSPVCASVENVGSSLARREYELQLSFALLRTSAAVLRAGAAAVDMTLESVRAELEDLGRQLASLPDDGRPMLSLAGRLGWSAHEVDFVWVTIALASDPRLYVHARALDPGSVQGLSTALYSRIAQLDPAGARAIGRALYPDQSLPRSGLLACVPGAWLPTSAPWRPVPELLHQLLDEHDRRLPIWSVELHSPAKLVLDDDQRTAIDLMSSALSSQQVLLSVQGARGTGRRAAVAAASAAHRPAIALDLARIDTSTAMFDDALLGLLREASLRDATAVIVGLEELGGREAPDARLRILEQRIDQTEMAVVLISARDGVELRCARPTVRVAWPVPDVGARQTLWRELAGDSGSIDHAALAHRFRIGAGAIVRAVGSARAVTKKASTEPLATAEIVAGVRHNIAERMAGLAERVVVKQTWDDCVLPEDVETQVTALIGRAEQAHVVYEQWGYRSKMPRGTGVAAMFSGPPGTGKTMVAGLIANQLGLELYQVDLSKIVSKWIGETEKQLSTLFDAAEDGHVVLLFDEADSLFGKRSTEMKGATDRYANLEVNFLLQRIENFHGIAILTTNLDGSIDKAFRRCRTSRASVMSRPIA